MSILTTYAPAAAASASNPRPGLFARIMTAMYEARMRQALRMLNEHRHLIADLSDNKLRRRGN